MLDVNTRGFREDLNRFDQIKRKSKNKPRAPRPAPSRTNNKPIYLMSFSNTFIPVCACSVLEWGPLAAALTLMCNLQL